MGSESGKDLSRLLDIKRVKPDGLYSPKIGHTVINWGSSRKPNWSGTATSRDVTILNKPEAVKKASNKLMAFEVLDNAGVSIPQFTTDMRTARYWLEDGHTIVERHTITGNSAEGVRVVNLDDETVENFLTDAPLYTKFIPKSREFRVHVFRGEVIDYREKKKVRTENRPENFNKYISSHTMGWVFCKNNIKHIDSVKSEAVKAVEALGLDFAAVDVMFYEGEAYVLEANTAPGITGSTLGNYVNTFRSFLGLPDYTFSMDSDGSNVEILNESSSPPSYGGIDVITDSYMSDRNAPLAADNSALDSGDVTLTLDRETARKLKDLLSAVS